MCSWNVAAPLGQSVPSLCGLRESPSMLTIFPSTVWMSVAQPTEQKGHTLGVTFAFLMRSSWACATAGARLTPEAISPPSAVPAPPATERRSTSRRDSSMADLYVSNENAPCPPPMRDRGDL